MRSSLILVLVAVLSSSLFPQAKSMQRAGPAKCHARLASLDKDYDFFASKSPQELEDIRKTLEDCLADSYDGLTKRELAVAGIELHWVQYLIDQGPIDVPPNNSGGTTDGEQISVGEEPTLKTGKLKISPLEIGSTFEFMLASGKSTCTVSSVEEMVCTAKASAYEIFVAAVVAQRDQRFLIGCRQYDSTCFRPQYGIFSAVVEGKTLRFRDWQVIVTNPKTGKTIDQAPAIFTVLTSLE
jgi:hypothetical protein